MKTQLLMLAAIGVLLGAAANDDKADGENIQGSWKVIATQDSGQTPPAEAIKNLKMVITKDKMVVMDGEKTLDEMTYKLDPANQPRWIDIQTDKEGKPTLGIYELKGDELKICFNEDGRERSTAFESSPHPSVNDVLIVLQREKP